MTESALCDRGYRSGADRTAKVGAERQQGDIPFPNWRYVSCHQPRGPARIPAVAAPRDRPVPLRVYIAPGCASCGRALDLVARARRERPGHPIEVVDLADSAVLVPEAVIGTPVFLIGDEVLSLGNPSLEELLDALDRAAGEE